ncbi:MAG TPA: leucine--tRNA ligase, partial [Gammaproteobacteria bacterium]|nr:leucine--tRNA ligase [Gammaproteobacteria bacterium]
SDAGRALRQEALEAVVLMLSPIVPHIGQVLWEALGHQGMVVDHPWPQADPAALEQDCVELVVQVNGKVRGRIEVAADAGEDSIRERALAEANVQRSIGDKTLRKLILVPGRLVNLVVG